MLHILTFKQLTNQKQSMVARITAQGRRKVCQSMGGGARSNVVGIICNPLFEIGLTDLHILNFKQLTNQKQSMVARITVQDLRKV